MEKAAYTEMAEVENLHWWFSARREIITSCLRRYCSGEGLSILDAGSGTGGNLNLLAGFGRVSALEMDADAAAYSRTVCPAAKVSVGKLPVPAGALEGEPFDLVTMFDVLEHVEDDQAAVISAAAVLKPGGLLFVTVPAFQWLFGPHDAELHHFRRYTAGRLRTLAEKAGLKVEASSYFNFLLFPAVVASRAADLLLRRSKAYGMKLPAPALNGLLRGLFASERFLMKLLPLPFGSSVMMIARKG